MRATRRALLWWIGAAVLTAGILGPMGTSAEPPAGDEPVIVLFRDGIGDAKRHEILGHASARSRQHFRHVEASAARVSKHARASLDLHPDVLAVIPDRPVQVLGKKTGGGMSTPTQVVPAGISRIGAAPGSLPYTGAGIGVAIVDTGIDFNHGDLKPAAACFSAYGGCQDGDGHGTHVAGTVAARNNGFGVVGVAPDATLYAVRVLDATGNGTDSTVMAGLDWVADRNAANVAAGLPPQIRVVNMSLGREGTLDDNPALRAAVQTLHAQGVVVVVAAGNDPGLDVSQQVPATYPEVLAIASTTAVAGTNNCRGYPSVVAADTASYFTSDGTPQSDGSGGVTVSAPGEQQENITNGCFLSSVGILSTRLGGGTVRMSGTSMAAPHVTGVVALMMQQSLADPTRLVTPEDVRRRLHSGASRWGVAPLNSPSTAYTYDGEREGVVSAPGALSAP